MPTRIYNLASFEQFTAVKVSSDGGDKAGKLKIPSCAQIILSWQQTNGLIAKNVLYGRFSGSFNGTVAQADAILAALTTGASWTALATYLAPGTRLAQVSIRNVDAIDQPLIDGTWGGQPGTSTGVALPGEIALVLTLKTGKAGISGRGRVYVPGWGSNAIGAGDVVAAAAVTAAGNWGALLRNTINANGYTHVLGLRDRQAYTGAAGAEHPARPATSETITAVIVKDNHWDSQRRRGLH